MNKLKTVKWGFIGCGEVTEKKSGPAFAMIEGSQVVAVMSRNKEKAESYAKRHNIPRWYTDVQQLIGDEDVNAVYIATPPSSHATFAIMAMKAGKPVYIEKPMAASYEDCARINRISQETGVPCFVAYYRRYLPYFQKVRQMVENGEIGNVINIQIRFAQPPRNLGCFYILLLQVCSRTYLVINPIDEGQGRKNNHLPQCPPVRAKEGLYCYNRGYVVVGQNEFVY